MLIRLPLLIRLEESSLAEPIVRDRARVLSAVASGAATARAQLAERLGLRSTTVSHLVGDLLARRLLLEASDDHRGPGQGRGRGRPAAMLLLNPERFGVVVMHSAGRNLVGALVDLSGRVLDSEGLAVPPAADNQAMGAALLGLASRLRGGLRGGMDFAGVSIALSGVMDLRQSRWLVSARWPRIDGLDVAAALAPLAEPVLVLRQIDVELETRLEDSPPRAGGTLLVHWGWGIGLAYAIDGRSFNGTGGPFGEIGHWRIASLTGHRCGCGNTGCLETGAALWALFPVLRQHWPELAPALEVDEAGLALHLRGRDIAALPEMVAAAELMAQALANLCRLLFPDTVLISGPLVANAAYWALFEAAFRKEGLLGRLPLPVLQYEPAAPGHLLRGAASPLLTRAVGALLRT